MGVKDKLTKLQKSKVDAGKLCDGVLTVLSSDLSIANSKLCYIRMLSGPADGHT